MNAAREALAVRDDAPMLHEVAGPLAALLSLMDRAEVDEDGVVAVPFDLLARIADLRVELGPAVNAVLGRVRSLDAWASLLDAEADRLKARAEKLRQRADRAAEAVRRAMIATGTKHLDSSYEPATIRNGSLSVDVTDEAAVPVEYRRKPAPPPPPLPPEQWAIDKTAAKDALSALVAKVGKNEIAPGGVVEATEGVIPGLRLVRGEPTLKIE